MQKKTRNIIIGIVLIALLAIAIFLILNKTKQTPQNVNELAYSEYSTKIAGKEYDIPDDSIQALSEIKPTISAGMIPIRWNGKCWELTTSESDNWYDYSNGQPAYIMLNDGTYQSKLVRDMENKGLKLASKNIEADIGTNELGSIYVWIPRYAYNEENEKIIYIKQECTVAGTWKIPSIFTYEIENRNLSLAGIWVEYNSLKSPSDVDTKVSNMIGENNQYGFIGNTIATNANNEKENITDIVKKIGKDIIKDSSNTNRTILKIVDTNKQEPIQANVEYNKTEERIDITVTYTKNGIKEILDENGAPLTTDGTTANTGDLKIEEKDYIFTVIDNKGNQMQFKITISFGIKASGVTASMYGAEVKGYTSASAGVDKWRIFHSDGTNIYLIADNYITRAQIPKTKNGNTLRSGTSTYLGAANFADTVNDYTGSAWIMSNQLTIANKWLTWVNSYKTSTNSNIKAVAYMMDTNVWSKFADSRYTDYCIGGPTLEMYCASYKQTHPTKYIECNVKNSYGYGIKWNTDTTYSNNSVKGLILDEYNGIYIKSDIKIARGLWLTSPSSYGIDYGIEVFYDGVVYLSDRINSLTLGFRPVVCLKSDVKLIENDNDTYSINK